MRVKVNREHVEGGPPVSTSAASLIALANDLKASYSRHRGGHVGYGCTEEAIKARLWDILKAREWQGFGSPALMEDIHKGTRPAMKAVAEAMKLDIEPYVPVGVAVAVEADSDYDLSTGEQVVCVTVTLQGGPGTKPTGLAGEMRFKEKA